MEGGLGFHLPWQVSGSLVPFGISPAVLLTRCSDTSMAAGGCSWGGGGNQCEFGRIGLFVVK